MHTGIAPSQIHNVRTEVNLYLTVDDKYTLIVLTVLNKMDG